MTAQETSEKILQIAGKLFVKNGFTATSMREIAAEAGIGKATIYYHFPDKDSIAAEMIKRTFGDMRQALKILEAEQDPRERIRVAVTQSVEYLLESADIISVLRREVGSARDVMQTEFRGFFLEYMNLLTEAIQRGIDSGQFRPVDPKAASRVLMTMMQGTFASVYLSGIKYRSNEEAAGSLLDIFFHGIEKH
ncbi:TetR family transcriptional regulator [Leptolinea sp. HRD-7]|nr:TetR family transcriptional regulator [Leptolinea sp. HRD-7]